MTDHDLVKNVHRVLEKSNNSYALSIANKALLIRLPEYYSSDIVHDAKLLEKYNSVISFRYWFTRNIGTTLILFTTKSNGDKLSDKETLKQLEIAWHTNTEHFYVTSNACRNVDKVKFFNKAKEWLANGNYIFFR